MLLFNQVKGGAEKVLRSSPVSRKWVALIQRLRITERTFSKRNLAALSWLCLSKSTSNAYRIIALLPGILSFMHRPCSLLAVSISFMQMPQLKQNISSFIFLNNSRNGHMALVLLPSSGMKFWWGLHVGKHAVHCPSLLWALLGLVIPVVS